MVQLINKRNFSPIDEWDIKKFQTIQDLIGLSVDKTSETHATVNIRIGVQERIRTMDELVKNQANTEEQYGITYQDINHIAERRPQIDSIIQEFEALRNSTQINYKELADSK